MEKLELLKKQVTKITNQIVEYQEKIEELDTVRDVLQREIELHEPINKNYDELPF